VKNERRPSHQIKPKKVWAERLGRWAEIWVAIILILRGYRILHHRYRSPHDEIDLITSKNNCIHFIEVKFRSRFDHIDQVLPHKRARQRLLRASQYYMMSRPDCADRDQEFSVVVVAPSLRLTWFTHPFIDL